MLTNLISATGFDLRLQLARPIDRLTGPVGRRVRRNRSKIRAIVADHGARNLRLFGSVARGDDRPDSDVDLLVDLRPGTGLLALARLQADLEAVLDARVDLVAPGDLKPNVRRRIERDLVTL